MYFEVCEGYALCVRHGHLKILCSIPHGPHKTDNPEVYGENTEKYFFV
jgi:hypothetical protein